MKTTGQKHEDNDPLVEADRLARRVLIFILIVMGLCLFTVLFTR